MIPRGDDKDPGRRMVDAAAAGCVPLLIGNSLTLTLAHFLPYAEITVDNSISARFVGFTHDGGHFLIS
jgi:hypothetical protein